MIIKTLPLGPLDANSYIIIEEESGACAVIDAGACDSSLLLGLEDDRIKKVEYILLTHGHFDHMNGVAELKKHFPDAKIAIQKEDSASLFDDSVSLAKYVGISSAEKTQADIILEDGEKLPFGGKEITVIHTPGHTKGSVTYMIDDYLFTGDTLFCCCVGRTDLPGGNSEILNDSVCKLFDMTGEFTVFPGHDKKTSLDFERKRNRFVRWKNR